MVCCAVLGIVGEGDAVDAAAEDSCMGLDFLRQYWLLAPGRDSASFVQAEHARKAIT